MMSRTLGTLALAGAAILGVGTASAGGTSLSLTTESTCSSSSGVVLQVEVDTTGAPLQAVDGMLSFDDDNLSLLGVFTTDFSASAYTLVWNEVDQPGPNVVDFALFTGTPQTPAAGTSVVQLVFEVTGPDATYPVTWIPDDSLIDETPPATLVDGAVTSGPADVSIHVPLLVTGAPADMEIVPVRADPADELSSFDVRLEFDPAVLMFDSVDTTGLVTEDFTLTVNSPNPGLVIFSLFKPSGNPIPLGTGEATIANVNFLVLGSLGDSSPLDITQAITDDGVSVCKEDGLFLVCPDADGDGATACPVDPEDCDDSDPTVYSGAPEICDGQDNQCPGDAGFGMVDEGFDPDGDSLASCFDNCPLDPNPGQEDGDGDLVGDVCDNCPMASNPAQEDADADGFGDACDVCPQDANPSLAEVAIEMPPHATGAPGAMVDVPVVANEADDLSSFDLALEFDPAVIQFVSAQTTTATAGFTLFSNNPMPGQVFVSLFSPSNDPIPGGTGAAEVVTITFLVVGTIGDVSDLDLTQTITDDDVVACPTDGQFEICADADGDGVTACATDPEDCNDNNPDLSDGPPLPVDDTVMAGRSGASIDLFWNDYGIDGVFRLYRGFIDPDTEFDYNHVCVNGQFAGPAASDPAVGPNNRCLYYLISRMDSCGESGLGEDSGGNPRPNDDRCVSVGVDIDSDGVFEALDNCPGLFNPMQEDGDADGQGDLCDNCPTDFNPVQDDLDMDGMGDVCDPDDDGDTVLDEVDNCPRNANATQDDADADGLGDVCDNCFMDPNPDQSDQDVDSVGDVCDNCPMTRNPGQMDGDMDGMGNACDPTP